MTHSTSDQTCREAWADQILGSAGLLKDSHVERAVAQVLRDVLPRHPRQVVDRTELKFVLEGSPRHVGLQLLARLLAAEAPEDRSVALAVACIYWILYDDPEYRSGVGVRDLRRRPPRFMGHTRENHGQPSKPARGAGNLPPSLDEALERVIQQQDGDPRAREFARAVFRGLLANEKELLAALYLVMESSTRATRRGLVGAHAPPGRPPKSASQITRVCTYLRDKGTPASYKELASKLGIKNVRQVVSRELARPSPRLTRTTDKDGDRVVNLA